MNNTGERGEVATLESNEAPEGTRVSRVWRGLAVLAAVIALVCALAAVKFASALRYTQVRDSAQIAALSDRITSLERDVEQARDAAARLQEQLELSGELARAALAPDSRIIRLTGLKPASQASAVIVLSPGDEHAMMRASGLPAAPPGKIYALWWIEEPEGTETRGALFRPGPDGAAIVAAAMPPAGRRIVVSAITLEAVKARNRPSGVTYLRSAANAR
jgi:cell division protein FtsB